MKTHTLTLLLPILLLGGCERKQEQADYTIPATSQPRASVTPTPKTKEKVQLELSDTGIDDQGYLQVRVQNHTSVPLDLINISWFFYDNNGNPIMKGDYPQSVLTTKAKDGSNSTIVEAGQSKLYWNSLIPVNRIFGEALDRVGFAEIKIYILRSEYDALDLDSPIACHEPTIRQVFQSSPFPLHQGGTAHLIAPTDEMEILNSTAKKAPEGRGTGMTPGETNALKEMQLRDSEEQKRAIASRRIAQGRFTEKEKAVFQYMKARWDSIAASPSGYDPDKHDDLVVSEAATKFGISKQEAKFIYINIDGAGLDLK